MLLTAYPIALREKNVFELVFAHQSNYRIQMKNGIFIASSFHRDSVFHAAVHLLVYSPYLLRSIF